jgi:signal transduction histidine kinase
MKIRDKLTLSFNIAVALVLVALGFTVYFFSSQYRKNEFYNRLKQRVDITEKMFLEKDNFSEEAYDKIREQFLNKLPEETEEVVAIGPDFRKQLTLDYPEGFIAELLEKKEAYSEIGKKQLVGKVFDLHDSSYLVLLTASDHVGNKMTDHLRNIILIALAGSIVAVSVVSHIVSSIVLNPVSTKIQQANNISAKNLHERLTVHDSDDEMEELVIAFNNLLDRVAKAFEAQKQFIDNASHEIRNPLTAIMGETEFALDKVRSQQEYISSFKSISLEADRLNSLVNNLLHLANISYKEFIFKKELIDIKNLILETKEKFDFLCPQNQVNIKFEYNVADSELLIEGNGHLLQTALINVLDNASKFSFFNLVDLVVSGRDDGTVTVSVSDKGVGIPDEDIPKVTQPFHRAPNVRQIQGTGIGIPLTVKIIELHKGFFHIQSKLNQGTQVRITLPVQ